MTKKRSRTTGHGLPDLAEAQMIHLSAAWRLPMAVAVSRQPPRRSGPMESFAPSLPVIQKCMSSWGVSCSGFPTCFRNAAAHMPDSYVTDELYWDLCCKKKTVVGMPLVFSGHSGGHLLCGCLPAALKGAQLPDRSPPLPQLAEAICQVACAPPGDGARFATALVAVRRQVQEVIRNALDCDDLVEAVSKTSAQCDSALRLMNQLLEIPDHRRALREALSSIGNVLALCRLSPLCDGAGEATLACRWAATWDRKGGGLELARKRRFPEIRFGGPLSEGWRIAGPPSDSGWQAEDSGDYSWDWRSLDEVGDPDPFAPMLRAIRLAAKGMPRRAWLTVGMLGRPVPRSCDIDPDCQAWRSGTGCSLFSRSPGKGLPHRRRLETIDLIITRDSPVFDMPSMLLVQTAARLAQRQLDTDELEAAALRGLPSLPQADQRYYLRYLLDRCTAVEDSQQKGAAFERLMDGLFGLVPGWFPGRRNTKDLAITKEFDLTVFVEPSSPSARYWFDVFGPKFLVECKNYPAGLPKRIKRKSPVAKLIGRLADSRLTLGFLVNTGTVPKSLWEEAEATAMSENLVVVLEREDLEALIDTPGDIEFYLKQWVSDAAVGISPDLSARSQTRRRLRRRR